MSFRPSSWKRILSLAKVPPSKTEDVQRQAHICILHLVAGRKYLPVHRNCDQFWMGRSGWRGFGFDLRRSGYVQALLFPTHRNGLCLNSRCFQATRKFRGIRLVPFILMKLSIIWLRYITQVLHHCNPCLQYFVPSYSSFKGYSYWSPLFRMVMHFLDRFDWSVR